MSGSLHLEAIGVCAGGMATWPDARAVLRAERPLGDTAAQRLPPSALLPSTERRRANETSRWALQAAAEAVAGMEAAQVAALPTVFASADGDGEVLAQVLRDLAAESVALSPTTFHNSVFNAPGGYWSIAARAPSASTTLCAAEATFAAGLLEAAAQARSSGGPVLLVAYDHPFPAGAPIGTRVQTAFACALVLAPRASTRACGRVERISIATGSPTALAGALAASFAGNPAAAGLALLQAVAAGAPAQVALPYLDDDVVALEWTPGA